MAPAKQVVCVLAPATEADAIADIDNIYLRHRNLSEITHAIHLQAQLTQTQENLAEAVRFIRRLSIHTASFSAAIDADNFCSRMEEQNEETI